MAEDLCYFLLFGFYSWFLTDVRIQLKPWACYVRALPPPSLWGLFWKDMGCKGTKDSVCLCVCFLSLKNEWVLVLWVKPIYISKGKDINMFCLTIQVEAESQSPASAPPLLQSDVLHPHMVSILMKFEKIIDGKKCLFCKWVWLPTEQWVFW